MPVFQELLFSHFIASVKSVLTLVTGSPVLHVETGIKETLMCENDLSGILHFSGTLVGTAALCMSKSLTRNVSQKLTELKDGELTDAIIIDTIGELINQIVGGVKSELEGSSVSFVLDTPCMKTGQQEQFTDYTTTPCVVMKFTVEAEELSLLLSIASDLSTLMPEHEIPRDHHPDQRSESEEKLVIDEDMKEIVEGFIVESEENIETLVQDCIALDTTPEDKELAGNIFRMLHTLKGNARGLGFTVMENMVHKTEDVIRRVRDGELTVTSKIIDVILQAADYIKALLQDVKEGKKSNRDLEPIFGKLQQAFAAPAEGDTAKQLVFDDDIKEIVEGFIVESEELLAQLDQDLTGLEKTPDDMTLVDSVFRQLHTLKGNSGSLELPQLEELAHQTEDVIRKVRDGKTKICPELMDVVLGAIDRIKLLLAEIKRGVVGTIDCLDIKAELALVLEEKYDALKAMREKRKTAATAQSDQKEPIAPTIRVAVNKLDTLIDVAGELVLQKNRLLNFTQQLEQGLYRGSVEEILNEINAQMGFLVSDLQFGVMSTRMQPIGKVFSKYPRVVRDLARDAGKEIELLISGQDTELDNTIVEQIGDPLIHMIRNSCDHGIETPDERRSRGKNPRGRIELKAGYEGNSVVIEIKDDGKGIDGERIRAKAIDKGIITRQQADSMPKGDVLNLIFLPGFSTAEKVTAVSGRGIGMDVVKTGISKLNGIIELDSEPGRGTSVKIKLPLTLAVMIGLEVEIGNERYLLPQDAIVEIVQVAENVFRLAKNEKKFLFRNTHHIPLVDLRDVLGNKDNDTALASKGYIVVIGEVEKRAGIYVDNVVQQQEVVIKPLGTYVNNFSVREVNGATIMGDGSIELILNTNHLILRGQEIGSGCTNG